MQSCRRRAGSRAGGAPRADKMSNSEIRGTKYSMEAANIVDATNAAVSSLCIGNRITSFLLYGACAPNQPSRIGRRRLAVLKYQAQSLDVSRILARWEGS